MMMVVVMRIAAVRMAVVTVPIIRHMAAVCATFGFERQIGFYDGHMHAAQHVGQHVIGFDLQMIGLQLNGYMAIAEVVCRAHEIKRRAVYRACRDVQHLLRRGDHTDQRAVFCHQHIATAYRLTAWQEDGQLAAGVVSGCEAAFLAYIPVELDRGSTLQKHACQAFT